ncbi:Crp/Fnr family transcriptional regulator [soil metagenome]
MNDSTPDLKVILANTSMYSMLDGSQLDQILDHTSSIRVRPNCSIVNQGDVAKGAFWLVYGQVKIVLRSRQGSEKTLEILGASSCFGLSEMLLEQPHLAIVKATADSLLLHVERDVILHIASRNFDFARELMSCVGRQFYSLVRDIETYSQSARLRLADYLLRQNGREPCQVFRLVANKALVASRLSLTPETLSRLFHDFSEEGLIEVSGRQITLLDRDKLALLLE